jgi:hypothetical protein
MIDPTEDEASFVLRLDAIAVVYSFITPCAASLYVRKSYDNK